jgi:hypothetical protein
MISIQKWLKGFVISGLAVVALAGGLMLAVTPVFAQADDAEPAAPNQGWMQRGGEERGLWEGGFHGRRGGERGAEQIALAEELGISVEELQAAQQAVREQALADAVAAGRITQEQADLMTAANVLRTAIDREAILAQALGLNVEDVAAAREDGTLRQLTDEIDREELRTRMQEATDAAIAQAVVDGVITQEQADQLAEGDKGFGGFPGGGHRRGARGK